MSVALSEDDAVSVSSLESSDDSDSVVPADGLGLWSLSEDLASLVTLVESLDDLGSLPESVPLTSGESGESSGVD